MFSKSGGANKRRHDEEEVIGSLCRYSFKNGMAPLAAQLIIFFVVFIKHMFSIISKQLMAYFLRDLIALAAHAIILSTQFSSSNLIVVCLTLLPLFYSMAVWETALPKSPRGRTGWMRRESGERLPTLMKGEGCRASILDFNHSELSCPRAREKSSARYALSLGQYIHLQIFLYFIGLKLLQAAILQQTTEYIYQLEQEKSRLVAQNCHLKRLLGE